MTRLNALLTGLLLPLLPLLPLGLACTSTEEPSASAVDAAAPGLDPAAAGDGPDVYLIVIDSLRADRLGVYGHDQPTSPNLDAFARDAVVFEHAQSTAPWTLPSVATMVTGHHPAALGIGEKASRVDDAVTTLGELYKQSGYATGAVISHIYLRPKYGLMQGMDFVDEHWVKKHEDVTSKGVTNRAIAHLHQHLEERPEQPLFMLVHYFDPHYDYILHPEHLDTYPDYEGPVQGGMVVKELKRTIRSLEQDQGEEAFQRGIKRVYSIYDSEVRFTDYHLGRFLDELRETGRLDNAVVVIVGDHGDELGDRSTRWIGHTKVVSEEVIHVPWIMRLPGGNQPRKRISTPVSLVDLLPTLAQASGLALPPELDMHGHALDLSSSADYWPTIFSETGRWRTLQAARKGRWKLVVDPSLADGNPSLYDLDQDPGELHSVLDAHPDVYKELVEDLETWRTAVAVDKGKLLPTEQEPELTEEEIEQLRAMGYIE